MVTETEFKKYDTTMSDRSKIEAKYLHFRSVLKDRKIYSVIDPAIVAENLIKLVEETPDGVKTLTNVADEVRTYLK